MNTETKIITEIKRQLGNTYSVITAYDATQNVNPDGVIAIAITQMEYLNHTGCANYKFTLTITGQTIAQSDITTNKMQEMKNYVLNKINFEEMKNAITQLAGIVKGNIRIETDGDTNTFFVDYDLFLCDVVFIDIASSSSQQSNTDEN